jgi:hypothetical protein
VDGVPAHCEAEHGLHEVPALHDVDEDDAATVDMEALGRNGQGAGRLHPARIARRGFYEPAAARTPARE